MEIQKPSLKLAALILAGGILLAVVLTLLVYLIFYAPQNKSSDINQFQFSESFFKTTDFMIDSPEPQWKGLEFTPLRAPMDKWNQSQIDAYYEDPEDILEDIINDKTERAVSEYFNNID